MPVIECEAHAQDDASLEALVRISRKSSGVIVSARMEQKRSDCFDFAIIDPLSPEVAAFNYVNDAHYHGCETRPLNAPSCSIDFPAVLTNPT